MHASAVSSVQPSSGTELGPQFTTDRARCVREREASGCAASWSNAVFHGSSPAAMRAFTKSRDARLFNTPGC